MAAWIETNSTLHKLECLLQCPLCNHTMKDPCTLDNCDHHFCRMCILGALSGRNSCCPTCGLPAWVKDLKSNRQLANMIRLLLHMKELTTGGEEGIGEEEGRQKLERVQPSSEGLPTPSNSAVTSNSSCIPPLHSSCLCDLVLDSPGPSHACSSVQGQQANLQHHPTSVASSTRSQRSSAERDKDVFRKPHIGDQLIKRRLKAGCKANPSHSLDGIPSSSLKSPSKTKTIGQANRPSLAVFNHRRAKSLPNSNALSPDCKYTSTDTASNKEHGATHNSLSALPNTFGHPKTKRRKSNSAGDTCTAKVSEFSLQFPFSPLVTKTRNYAKLGSGARMQRLKQAGCPQLLPQKRPQFTSGLGAPKHRRVNQLKMETFVQKKPVTSGCTATVGRSSTMAAAVQHSGRSSMQPENPVPATPSSAHARTMRRNIRGETPLHIATIKGDLSAVRTLLQQGADPNAKDHAGWTPLHEACNHGYVEMVSLLLDHGALVNIPGFENDTPLHDAVANGHMQVASLLVARGANINVRNRKGLSACDLAVTDAMKRALTRPISSPGLLISPNSIRNVHASPLLNGGCGRVVLLATGLRTHQKNQLEELADLLGAEVVDSFCDDVSHVVTVCDKRGCCPRTLKFLCAVALGKWIVSFQWITKCLQERNWVDETPYEVQGITIGDSTLITKAPRKGRENASQKAPGLFDGCQFYFSGVFPPPRASKEDLSHLVKLAGGSVLTREPRGQEDTTHICPYHAKPQSPFFSSHTFVVYDSHVENSPGAKAKTSSVVTVPSLWLLDCLSHFELVDTPVL